MQSQYRFLPILHHQRFLMACQVRILASATITDMRGRHFDILEYIGLLRRHGMALCLRLKKRRRDSAQTQERRSFLEAVLGMLECQHIGSHLEIDEVIGGAEWRRRPSNNDLPDLWIGSETRRLFKIPDLSCLDRVPLDIWGPGTIISSQTPTNERGAGPHWPYLLIVHPWGPDAIQFVQVPERIAKTGATQSTAPGQLVLCQLCEKEIHIADFSSSPCWFHPGKRCNFSMCSQC